MSITVERAWESPTYSGDSALQIDVGYLIFGTDDDAEAYVALKASHTSYAGAPASGWRISERRGDQLYVGTITYTIPANESGYEFSFSTAGGTAKMTQARATVHSHAVSGTPPNVAGAIGVTKDGVEGCDVIVPTFSWKETHVYSTASINEAYMIALANVTGSVNSDSFRSFEPGEVRFDGVDGRQLSPIKFAIDYSFSASPNATGLTIGAMSGISKKGWEYLWILYGETTSNNRLVKVPIACYVNQVYPYIAFAGLGI